MTAPNMAERLRDDDRWCSHGRHWLEVGDSDRYEVDGEALCKRCNCVCEAADGVTDGAAGAAAEGEA